MRELTTGAIDRHLRVVKEKHGADGINMALAAGAASIEHGTLLDDESVRLFKKSGAFGLSFQVISAAGKNGAVIHYSTPDEHTPIKAGELFLLDTVAVVVLVFAIYFPRHRRRDMIVALLGINVGVLGVTQALSSTTVSA